MDYQTPTGFLYPILGSFRALIVQEIMGIINGLLIHLIFLIDWEVN